MAVMMISELEGAGPEALEALRAQGVFDKMTSAPGFLGHWSGTTDKGVCVLELWESEDAHHAWFAGTIEPILPPGANATYSYIQVLNQLQPH